MRWIIILLICLGQLTAFAQQPKEILVVGFGANAYNGDLGDRFDKWGSFFSVGVKLNHKYRLNGNLSIGIGSITGQEVGYTFNGPSVDPATPNTFFKTRVLTVNYDLHYNFIKKGPWIVYISQGLGLVSYIPKDEFSEDLVDQSSTRVPNETYGSTSIVAPTQIGAFYLLSNGLGFGFQTGFLNTLTDYLDNVSQWGNQGGNDNILIAKFSLLVSLNKKPADLGLSGEP